MTDALQERVDEIDNNVTVHGTKVNYDNKMIKMVFWFDAEDREALHPNFLKDAPRNSDGTLVPM